MSQNGQRKAAGCRWLPGIPEQKVSVSGLDIRVHKLCQDQEDMCMLYIYHYTLKVQTQMGKAWVCTIGMHTQVNFIGRIGLLSSVSTEEGQVKTLVFWWKVPCYSGAGKGLTLSSVSQHPFSICLSGRWEEYVHVSVYTL